MPNSLSKKIFENTNEKKSSNIRRSAVANPQKLPTFKTKKKKNMKIKQKITIISR